MNDDLRVAICYIWAAQGFLRIAQTFTHRRIRFSANRLINLERAIGLLEARKESWKNDADNG